MLSLTTLRRLLALGALQATLLTWGPCILSPQSHVPVCFRFESKSKSRSQFQLIDRYNDLFSLVLWRLDLKECQSIVCVCVSVCRQIGIAPKALGVKAKPEAEQKSESESEPESETEAKAKTESKIPQRDSNINQMRQSNHSITLDFGNRLVPIVLDSIRLNWIASARVESSQVELI